MTEGLWCIILRRITPMPKITPVEEIKKRLPRYVRIIEDTYQAIGKPALFIDEHYGFFESSPKYVFRGYGHTNRNNSSCRRRRWTAGEFEKTLKSHVKLDKNTWAGYKTKARFIDSKYGEFWCSPHDVQSGCDHPVKKGEKTKSFWLEKYGAESPMLVREIYSKAKKSMRRSTCLTHWKTNEEVVCVGTYETRVVEHLNQEKIDFEWQPLIELPSGMKYYCDLYIKPLDLYVEIKGWWMQQRSKDKWEEFHSLYPNSELWNRPKLRSIGIMVK